MSPAIKANFHCFVVDDQKRQRDIIAETLRQKGSSSTRTYAHPQQMSEDIDRLHAASLSTDPVFAVIDGSMYGANYEGTSCERPAGDQYKPNITDALLALSNKQKEGKIGDYIIALHSGHVGDGNTFGKETPIDSISSDNFKPNPGDYLDVIKIQKASKDSRNLIIKAFEFAKDTFSSMLAQQ